LTFSSGERPRALWALLFIILGIQFLIVMTNSNDKLYYAFKVIDISLLP